MSEIIFNDPLLNARFHSDGYLVLPSFLTYNELSEISAFYTDIKNSAGVSDLFYTSNWSKNYDYRHKTSKFLRSKLTARAHAYLNGYKAVYAHFMIKNPGVGSRYALHQDWSIVDESIHTGVTFWCPLSDVDAHNGCLTMIKGSHTASGNIRGSNIGTDINEIPASLCTVLPINAGDAVAFDQRIFHSSSDNISSETRIAGGIVMIPEQSRMIHYYKNPHNDSVAIYQATDDFLENFSVGDDIQNYSYPCIGTLPIEKTRLRKDELIQRLNQVENIY